MATSVTAPKLPFLGAGSVQQRLGLMFAAAALIALTVGAWLWIRMPDYRVLYSNLADRDGGAIVAALDQMQVPYKFSDGGGSLMVPAEQVHAVRLKLAGQGLPKGGLVGFEAMDNQKLGVSQFAEQVTYQRALEGELARSVQSISAVEAARVHLAIPKPTVFVREQLKPSASVLVQLYPGKALDAAQVSAIVHLVANSVPELSPKNVTVLDQQGNLLSQPDGAGGVNRALEPGQIRYVREMELALAERIKAIVTPLMGPNNVQAQVTADVDFSESETVAETYAPNQKADTGAIRSQQASESVNTTGAGGPGGVPGALSNQPPGQASAPIVGSAATTGAGTTNANTNSRRDTTTNYEVDKTVKHTRDAIGRLKRLSVAVVLNHREITEKGKTTSRPLQQAELDQITNLVKDAIGFNKDRGDSVNVVNSSFVTPKVEAPESVPMWKQPENIALAKDLAKHLLIASVLLYVLLGVLRPMMRSLLAPKVSPATDAQLRELALTGRAEPLAELETTPQLAAQQQDALRAQLHKTREIAKQDPQVVAGVLKNWMTAQ